VCERCDYRELLRSVGLAGTARREMILETIGNHHGVLRPSEILTKVRQRASINRVTLYRILDLLVGKGLVRRLSASDRVFRYGLAATPKHPDHAHFHCLQCGHMECLAPTAVPLRIRKSGTLESASIEHVEIRLDGVCQACRTGSEERDGVVGRFVSDQVGRS
jgi:Fur family ferric uptake transcriptional regulator